MDRTLYNASGCKDKTAHDAICSASKPQTQVFRSDWTRRDNEADMFVKMVKRLAKGFNFKPVSYTHLTLPTNREV